MYEALTRSPSANYTAVANDTHKEAAMPNLHLMIGLPCSGKTTLARRIAAETGAFLFSTDAWHLRLYGDDLGQDGHMVNHRKIEALLWEVAAHALSAGCDVILDFGFWTREQRDLYRRRAEALGAVCVPHYLNVPMEELRRRIRERNADPPEDAFVIPLEMMDLYISHFEHPDSGELGRPSIP